MPVTRLNHAVLYVRDVDASVEFYTSMLGFRTVMAFPGAAFLQASGSTNDHDLGLFQIGRAGRSVSARAVRRWGSITWRGRSTPSTSWRRPAARLERRGRARRRHRSRHDQGVVCQGPRRHRVRGELARACRAAVRGGPGLARIDATRSTSRRRSPGSAARRSAASASPSLPEPRSDPVACGHAGRSDLRAQRGRRRRR